MQAIVPSHIGALVRTPTRVRCPRILRLLAGGVLARRAATGPHRSDCRRRVLRRKISGNVSLFKLSRLLDFERVYHNDRRSTVIVAHKEVKVRDCSNNFILLIIYVLIKNGNG